MPNIEFENRAVAFIDVLGFKSIVCDATQDEHRLNELKDLIDVLESAVPNLNGQVNSSVSKNLIPMHIYISDSIILSAPLESDENHGLSTLVMRVIQISHILFSKGYLIRGGISIGSTGDCQASCRPKRLYLSGLFGLWRSLPIYFSLVWIQMDELHALPISGIATPP
jgi:hypothetical protein